MKLLFTCILTFLSLTLTHSLRANSFVALKASHSISGEAKSQSPLSLSTAGVALIGYWGFPIHKFDTAGITIAYDINKVDINFMSLTKSGFWSQLQLGGAYSMALVDSINAFFSGYLVLLGNMVTQSRTTTLLNGEEFQHSSITNYSGTTSFGATLQINLKYQGYPFHSLGKNRGAAIAIGLDYLNQGFDRITVQSVSTDSKPKTEEADFELSMNLLRFTVSFGIML